MTHPRDQRPPQPAEPRPAEPRPSGLPLRENLIPSPRTHRRIVIAHHLVLTGYGHWLSNDIRGSGSTETRMEELRRLGPVHFGRKRVQPPRHELRAFYQEAEPLLDHETL